MCYNRLSLALSVHWLEMEAWNQQNFISIFIPDPDIEYRPKMSVNQIIKKSLALEPRKRENWRDNDFLGGGGSEGDPPPVLI